jgi:predicted nucleotidyltransferase
MAMSAVSRRQVIRVLRDHADELRSAGVTSLYLFGSVARGDAGDSSDVDVFFEHRSGVRGLNVIGLYQLIESVIGRELGCRADVAARGGLHPRMRERIEADAVRVF